MIVIPRTFHRIWLGNKPIPDDFEKYWKNWQQFYPDFTFVTWNEDKLREMGLINEGSFNRAMHYSEQSDIARYEILYKFGGIYLDTDFDCLKRADVLLSGVTNFCCQLESKLLAVGILGVIPDHPLYKILVNNIQSNFKPSINSESAGPLYYTAVVDFWQQQTRLNDITIFERRLFYPYHYTEMEEKDNSFLNAYAVHHWATSYRDPNFKK